MAVVISHPYSSIRGSIAGTTYLTTPSGAIIARQRVKPVNAPSPSRTIVKSSMIEAVSRWKGLTTAERSAWNAWALANPLVPAQDGRHQMVAGQCIASLGALGAIGGWPAPIVDYLTVPEFNGHPTFTVISVPFTSAGATGVRFHVKNVSSFSVVVFAELSPPLSESRNYWKGPWDPATWAAGLITAGSTQDIDFSGLVADSRYFTRMRCMSYDATAGKHGRVVSSKLITWSKAVTNP